MQANKPDVTAGIRFIDYEPKHGMLFRNLNEQWISENFKMEEADYKALDHPQEYILDKGGAIVVALYNEEPVGVFALIKMDDPKYEFELAKMAVASEARGRNIGWLMGIEAMKRAKAMGSKWLYLESNTALKPAINLYHKLGFQRVYDRPTPYERCNIQMEVEL